MYLPLTCLLRWVKKLPDKFFFYHQQTVLKHLRIQLIYIRTWSNLFVFLLCVVALTIPLPVSNKIGASVKKPNVSYTLKKTVRPESSSTNKESWTDDTNDDSIDGTTDDTSD